MLQSTFGGLFQRNRSTEPEPAAEKRNAAHSRTVESEEERFCNNT